MFDDIEMKKIERKSLLRRSFRISIITLFVTISVVALITGIIGVCKNVNSIPSIILGGIGLFALMFIVAILRWERSQKEMIERLNSIGGAISFASPYAEH